MKFIIALSAAIMLLSVMPAKASYKSPTIDTTSPKYAALVMDADTGEVLFSRSADAKRYPASLTKMMTLYLAFEAMNKGKLRLDTRMKVSKRAASQPQTNISLKAGQTIPVRDAIKALVVRSANDVAVVFAEHIGKTEWSFAQQMTAKARSLGMRGTNFRNPHGLPDRKQYTTARDMAKLAIALRRDFPQYYHYFKTESFVWKGKTYTSHNRVMGRVEGADGLKTGYIRMSGFNLVTSVTRGGYHIVSVVMGGQNSKARDNHMVALLERTFQVLAERKDQPRQFANAPTPVAKPQRAVAAIKKQAAIIKVSDVKPSQKVAFNIGSTVIKPTSKPHITLPAPKVGVKKASARPNTLQYQLASMKNLTSKTSRRGDWGIQVGAFSDERSALNAVANAVKLARSSLKDSKVMVTDKGSASKSIHRARLANLSEYQAKQACHRLSANNAPCFVYRLDL